MTDLGGSTLYADVSVDGSTVTKDMEYRFDDAADTFGVMQLSAKGSYVAEHSGKLALSFHAAKASERKGASPLLSATVYAVCIQVDGAPLGSTEEGMIGIRTAKPSEAELVIEAPAQIVRGNASYRLVGSGKVAPTLRNGVLYVPYQKVNESQSVSASVLYVDEQDNSLQCDEFTLLPGEQKSITLRSSIEANGTMYTPLSPASQATISSENPEQRIHCVARAAADETTQQVTLVYASGKEQLMVDRVDVGAGGYLYAPATTLSRANEASVMRYELTGASDSLGNTYSAKEAQELSLSRDGAQTYTLQYRAQETELTYAVNFALVSAGKNGNTEVRIAKQEQAKVTARKAADIALPKSIEQDGTVYTRFGSETALTYTWSDLQGARTLSDTVYYVAPGVLDPQAYNVTVRYVDAVSGTQIGTELLTCNTDGAALSISSPDTVSCNGKEYKRLSGQSGTIVHRYYAPYRVYTVHYAAPGTMSQGDVTVTRTEVIDGGVRRYTIASDGTVSTEGSGDGGLIASVPYSNIASSGAAQGAAATQGDATAPSGNTAYEERIDDDLTPLASGADVGEVQPKVGLLACTTAALLALGLVTALIIRRKRSGRNGNGMEA